MTLAISLGRATTGKQGVGRHTKTKVSHNLRDDATALYSRIAIEFDLQIIFNLGATY